VSPLKPLDSWVSIARYLVDHAQYTAGRRLCGYALELARCVRRLARQDACRVTGGAPRYARQRCTHQQQCVQTS
jgi:hypothetical protein